MERRCSHCGNIEGWGPQGSMDQDSTSIVSLFVGNLYPQIDSSTLRNYFIKAGNVIGIHIPKNQKTHQKGIYAFVRFGSHFEASKVIDRCNGDFVWGSYLSVRRAHRERKEALASQPIHQFHQNHSVTPMMQMKSWQPRQIQPNYHQQGKSLEKRGEAQANLEYSPKEGDIEWLKGCAVGYLSDSYDIHAIQLQMVEEQSIKCSLRFIGGKMVLLSFLSKDLMMQTITEHHSWFGKFFEFIKPWEYNEQPRARYVWLKCVNVPIHAWNVEFFKLIGVLHGKFVAMDNATELKDRLDVGRILVHTTQLANINSTHRIKIQDQIFEVRVFEDLNRTFNPCKDMKYLRKHESARPVWIGESHHVGVVEEDDVMVTEEGEIHNSNSNLALGANNSVLNLATVIPNTLSPSEAVQFVPESPLQVGCSTSPAPAKGPSNQNQCFEPPHLVAVAQSQVSPSVVVAAADHHNDEYVSESELEGNISQEDYLVHETAVARKLEKRAKWISRRKAIDGIGVNTGSGKIPKQATFKYSRKSNFKKKGLPTHEGEDDSYGVDNLRKEQSSAKSVKIHNTTTSAWKLGQLIGLSHPGGDIGALNLLNGIECRNWDDFEKLQNQ